MSHFKPIDEAAHRKACTDPNVPDRCRICGVDFMDHTNGRCPTFDEIHINPELKAWLEREGWKS